MEKARKIFLTIGILVGLGIMTYPFISTAIDNRKQKTVALNVAATVQNTDEEELKNMMQQCVEYNSTLAGIPSIYNEDGTLKTISEDEYMSLLDFGNGAMGTLEIPALDLELPIYHGTTNEIISKGAGHLYGSSLPVGGVSTHTILVSHSGLSSATLFTHLNDLVPGDVVYIHILNEVHAYTVTDKQIVLPEEVDTLGITKDQDLLTLVTCYPVTVNTHRLLVNCERDEAMDQTEEKISETAKSIDSAVSDSDSDIWNAVDTEERDYLAERDANQEAVAIAICIACFLGISLLIFILDRKRRGDRK